MRFTSTRSGESLDDLVSRAYRFKDRGTRAERRAAGEALIDANPFLKRLDDVPEDTLLAVPEIAEAEPAPGTSDVGSTAIGALLGGLRGGIEAAIASLEADLDEDISSSRESIRFVRRPEVKKVARADSDAAEELKELAKVAEARVDDARALARYRRTVLSRLEKDVDELFASFGESEASGHGRA